MFCGAHVAVGDTALVSAWHNSAQHFPSTPLLIPGLMCWCLPVIGNLRTEVPLLDVSVQDIVANVGFSTFHAFDIYIAFGDVKIVLQHWPSCRLLPKEFISNLFPESWNKCDTLGQCWRVKRTDRQGDTACTWAQWNT